MINHFTFNGTSTAQLGLIVSGVSIFGAGSRKVEKAGIPGRNGDLQIELGGFNNYTVRYTVSITKNFTTTAQQIREWLLEAKGYCDLTDTYHPDEIRKACFNSDIEFTTSMLYKYGQASIQFDCLPERYLTTNTPITTTATADTTTDTTMSLSTVPTPINISLNGNTTQEGSSGKNLLDSGLLLVSNWTKSGDVYSGDLAYLYNAYGTNTDGIYNTFTANTQYTFSLDLKADATTQGLLARFVYTDNTNIQMTCQNPNTTDFKHYTLTSESGKSISKLIFSYANGMTVHIQNMQLEKGSTATAYEPHISPTNPQVIHNVSGDNTVNVVSKNIMQITRQEQTINNVKFTPTSDGTILVNGTASANVSYSIYGSTLAEKGIPLSGGTTYIVSGDDKGISVNIQIMRNGSGITISSTQAVNYFTAQDGDYISFCWLWQPSGTVFNNVILKPMVEKGSTATTYEPYTRQSYPLYLPVKNLFDRTQVPASLVSWTYYVPNFGDNAKAYPIYIGKGKTATFKSNIPTLTSGNGFYAINALSEGSTNTLNDTHERTISANNSGYVYVGMITSRQYYQEVIDGTYYIHVTVGNVSNVQDYSIELNKIGTYQDYIYKNGGKWYVHKETASVDMGTLTYQTDNGGVYFYSSVSGKGRTNFDLLCTCYTVTTSTNTSGMTDYQVKGQTSGAYIFIKDSRYTSPTDLKTALSGETLKYNLVTPTNTEITDTTLINQLNNIEKAYSYNGTTNILQVSNDNGFMLEVVSLHGSTFNSNYKGEPIITVNATGLIYLNGEVMEVLSAPVTINCQTMQCYNGVVNMNNEVRVNDFPEIKIGANEVGSSMALTITPNNWRH